MDTLSAFALGQANKGNPLRVFDWVRAAEKINHLRLKGEIQVASAGLRDDWEWTGGRIYANGQIVPEEDTYTYLSSTWAIPELEIDGEVSECWIWEEDSPGWDFGTYWPPEALAILNNKWEQ